MYYKKMTHHMIPRLVGYMLANDGHIVDAGGPWSEQPERVWICRDLKTAQNILRASQNLDNKNTPVWTTIYRVCGENIECDHVDPDFYHTPRADKIRVVSPVHYQASVDLLRTIGSMRRFSATKGR